MRVKLYIPLSLVLAVNTVPRSTSRATTSAPLMGDPPGSTTVPVIAAVTFWPDANCAPPSSASEITRHRPILKKLCMATTSSDLLATEPHFQSNPSFTSAPLSEAPYRADSWVVSYIAWRIPDCKGIIPQRIIPQPSTNGVTQPGNLFNREADCAVFILGNRHFCGMAVRAD